MAWHLMLIFVIVFSNVNTHNAMIMFATDSQSNRPCVSGTSVLDFYHNSTPGVGDVNKIFQLQKMPDSIHLGWSLGNSGLPGAFYSIRF